jgi:hypothetical protein
MGTARTCLIHGHERARVARGLDRVCRYLQTSLAGAETDG